MELTIAQNKIRQALSVDITQEKVQELVDRFQPYDLALLINELSRSEKLNLFQKLPIELAAETLVYLEPEVQYEILGHLDDQLASSLLVQMSSDDVTDMLLAIHPHQANLLLGLLPDDYRNKINQLMTYPEYTAGSLMTVDYISARAYWNAEQTMRHIRKVGRSAEIVAYIYVTDARGELVGVASLKEIILATPETRLSSIATTDIISVPAELEQEEVANILSRYDLVALPVVDVQKRLIGIITYDDILEVLEEEATEDFQKLGGSQPLDEPYFKTSNWQLFMKRIIWLLVLFVGGSYTANVLEAYQLQVDKVVALSFFIPLLIGTGGNTGSQIVTTLVRALGVGEVQFSDILKVLRKELLTGLLLGISLGAMAFFRALIMDVEFEIGYVVALSALSIVLWASIVSAILPIVLHRLRLDPAVVSGPLITTLVDGTGLIIYFSIAQVLLNI